MRFLNKAVGTGADAELVPLVEMQSKARTRSVVFSGWIEFKSVKRGKMIDGCITI